MDKLQKVWGMLDGWKMYMTAATIVLAVVLEKGMGVDVPGVEVGNDWMNYIWTALGVAGLKSALPPKA